MTCCSSERADQREHLPFRRPRRSTPVELSLTRMMMHTVEVYRRSKPRRPAAGSRAASMRLACIARARGGGAPSARLGEDLRPADGARIGRARRSTFSRSWSRDGVLGACGSRPTASSTRAGSRTRWPTGPARGGARSSTHTRVTDIDVERRPDPRGRTDRGTVESEVVVTAAACSPPRSGAGGGARADRADGASVPDHQADPTATARAPDAARPRPPRVLPPGGRRAGDRRLRAPPRAVVAQRARLDRIPPDFNNKLLPEDWDRFEEIAENRGGRARDGDDQVTRLVNGPEAFTPDNEFCSARPRCTASSSPPASARTASRAQAASAG